MATRGKLDNAAPNLILNKKMMGRDENKSSLQNRWVYSWQINDGERAREGEFQCKLLSLYEGMLLGGILSRICGIN